MMRFIMPIILIGISITAFFVFTNPIYNDISQLGAQSTSYNEALNNSKALENTRDVLTAKYNAIDPNNLARIQKLVPDNIDNIRLILEIEQIATPYGMVLKNVKYSPTTAQTTAGASAPQSNTVAGPGSTLVSGQNSGAGYGVWDLEFSITSTYNNFLNFSKDLENNLRIVDISSISFSSTASSGLNSSSAALYDYDFKIKTYWLQN
jgi:Tfp pilus assembly protein PilO